MVTEGRDLDDLFPQFHLVFRHRLNVGTRVVCFTGASGAEKVV